MYNLHIIIKIFILQIKLDGSSDMKCGERNWAGRQGGHLVAL